MWNLNMGGIGGIDVWVSIEMMMAMESGQTLFNHVITPAKILRQATVLMETVISVEITWNWVTVTQIEHQEQMFHV